MLAPDLMGKHCYKADIASMPNAVLVLTLVYLERNMLAVPVQRLIE